jgi:RNA polymerase sigma-70 factor (ECF subfamily)
MFSMHAPRIDARTVERLHRQAGADRWDVPLPAFAAALEASLERAAAEAQRKPERYLASLHLEDLALACACATGHEPAWEHFIREHRPILYRAADALVPGGAAREIADSLYGELYGMTEKEGERRSLFRYFHGRSSLGTWLRAVLAQRVVDGVRAHRRLDPLPEDDAVGGVPQVTVEPDPDQPKFVALVQQALATAMAALGPRDRLRLGFYYAQELTLAQTGRLMGEHEATVSRQLARTRRLIREQVEEALSAAGLTPEQIDRSFELAMEDVGALDLSRMVGADRKNPEPDRST